MAASDHQYKQRAFAFIAVVALLSKCASTGAGHAVPSPDTRPAGTTTSAPRVETSPAPVATIPTDPTTQPATTQPATTQPATTQPATTQPATTQPATTVPVSGGGRPFSALSAFNTPTPAGTAWYDTPRLHTLKTPNVDGDSRLHWWVGTGGVGVNVAQPGDPVWTFRMPDYVAPAYNRNRPAQTFQVHAPITLQDDGTNDHIVTSGNPAYNGGKAGWATGNIHAGPGAGSTNNDGVRAANFSWIAGLITGSDLASGTIDHALAIALPYDMLNHGFRAPATSWDDSGTGLIQNGSRIGILGGAPQPAGLSPVGIMVFNALKKYGAFVGDFTGGLWPLFYADSATVTDAQVAPLYKFWNYNGSADMDKIIPLLRVADYQP
jgi:hypothetical protein